MNKIKFTQELKDKWLDALKSGEYKHGKGLLRTNDNCYCCLGVLCDVAGIEISPDGTECIKDEKK